jgi:glucose/arabinose dehydrogenase
MAVAASFQFANPSIVLMYNRSMRQARLWILSISTLISGMLGAQTLTDPSLTVETVISGLTQPIAIEFLRPDDPNRFFVIERTTGRVKLVENGVVTATVLDLPVNYPTVSVVCWVSLSIPTFANNGYVYLYYSRSTTGQR